MTIDERALARIVVRIALAFGAGVMLGMILS